MAHYAFLDENNIVVEVITGVDENQFIDGLDPETWYGNFRGLTCKRTSYNTSLGEHKEGGEPFRKNYAGIGYFYNQELDAFIPPKLYSSWIFNEEKCIFEAPSPKPIGFYTWVEDDLNWQLVESGA